VTLTPDDIEQQVFKEKFRGYDPDEVDRFLDRVSATLTAIGAEREELLRRVRYLEQEAGEAAEAERLLKRTLLTAQKTADEIVTEARQTADATLERARAQAEQLVAEARRQTLAEQERLQAEEERLLRAVGELQRFRSEYHERVRGVIAEHLSLLEQSGGLPDVPPGVHDLARRLQEAEHPTSILDIDAVTAGERHVGD
jgi:cell division initiation protein